MKVARAREIFTELAESVGLVIAGVVKPKPDDIEILRDMADRWREQSEMWVDTINCGYATDCEDVAVLLDQAIEQIELSCL